MVNRKYKYVISSLLCLFAIALPLIAATSYRYRYFLQDMYFDYVDGSTSELAAKVEFYTYFSDYLGRLEFSKDRDPFFPNVPAKTFDTKLDQAIYLFHQGRYHDSSTLVKEGLGADKYQSEDYSKLWLATIHLYSELRPEQAPRARLSEELSDSPEKAIPLEHSLVDPGLPYAPVSRLRFQKLAQDEKGYSEALYIYLSDLLSGRPDRATHSFVREIAEHRGDTKKMAAVLFSDKTREWNIDLHDSTKGIAAEDLNLDGYLDLVVASSSGPLRIYFNRGGRQFELSSFEPENSSAAYAVATVDFDNDGWMDIFVSRPFHHYTLLRNIGDGTFEDVTQKTGLMDQTGGRLNITWGSAWGDIDRDGDLDLFVAQMGMPVPGATGAFAGEIAHSRLYIQNGDGSFLDATEEYGLLETVQGRNFMAARFGDIDSDGYPELFLSSFSRRRSVLLKNTAGKKFSAISEAEFIEPGFNAFFFDREHNGKIDLFQTPNLQAKTSLHLISQPGNTEHLGRLWSSSKKGLAARGAQVFEHGLPINALGATYGDVDNDGCWDLYIGTGNPEPWYLVPDLFYFGNRTESGCSGSFTLDLSSPGHHSYYPGQGVLLSDFDNDGDEDLFVGRGGMWPAFNMDSTFLENSLIQVASRNNGWAKVRLKGIQSNSSGIGADVWIYAQNERGEPIIKHAVMDNKSGFGSAPYLIHFGLRDAATISSIQVHWPVSQKCQEYVGELRAMNVLREDQGAPCRSPNLSSRI